MRMLIVIASFTLALGTYAAFAQGSSDQPTEVGKTGVYTCPNHPGALATWPTQCPLCQTTLRVILAAAQAGDTAGGGTGAASGQAGTTPPGTQRPMQEGTGTFGRDGSSRTFERERGMNAPSARDPFRSREFGQRFPDRQFEEPFPGPEQVFPRDRFGFDDEFGDALGEDRFFGPEEVFPRDQSEFEDDFRTKPFDWDFERQPFDPSDRFRTEPFDQDVERQPFDSADRFRTQPFERDFRSDRFEQDRFEDDFEDDQFADEFERDRPDWKSDIWTRRFSNEGFRRDPFGLEEDFGTPGFDDDRFQHTLLTSVEELDTGFIDAGSGDDTGPSVVE